MISKVKGIILVVIVSISLASIMMPFTVYADTISSTNVIGVNVELLGSTILEHREDNGNNYYFKQYSYKAVIELDNSYVGVIGARVQGQYYEKAPVQGSQLLTQAFNYYRKIYVNGNSAEMTFVISTWYSSVQDPINYRSDGTSPYVTIEDSNVTKYEDLDSIEQIIDILGDIYQNSNDIEGLSTNQLNELQSIVSNTSLANTYLETLIKLRQFDVSFESLPVVMYLMSRNSNQLLDISQNNFFTYPLFNLPTNTSIYQTWINTNVTYKFIFIVDKNVVNVSSFSDNFDLILSNGNTVDVSNYQNISNQFSIRINNTNRTGYICSVDLNTSRGSNLTIKNKTDMVYSSIYFGLANNKYLSTDFALRFGLSNSLLDNIQIIANGTQQSNSAASDLETEASEYSEIADDVIGVEEGLTSNFETSVNQIDLNTGLNAFGGNFMTSATWVRTQFDRLTENTPYGSLVVYGLTLGFVLLMLGKVLL